MKSRVASAGVLFLTAFIWGVAFVAQSVGMEYIGPFTFNCIRFFLGGVVLLPVIFFMERRNTSDRSFRKSASYRKSTIVGGIWCGIFLCLGSTFQQFGIQHTSVGKAGFITALYIIIVPILGVFFHKKITPILVFSAIIAVTGFYLLCISGQVHINQGDLQVLGCALLFSIHIMVIDHYSPKGNGVIMSCIQFFVSGIISGCMMLLFEKPQVQQILSAYIPILYAGIMSCGVAYTLQIVGQKNMNPTVASLILSLESVFSALAGWLLLKQSLSFRELCGCGLVFFAVILAQLPVEKIKRSK